MIKVIGILSLAAVLALACLFWYFARKSQTMTPALGVSQGLLLSCPNKPNCITSTPTSEGSSEHIMPAISVEQDPLPRIKETAAAMNLRLQSDQDNYLHFTAQSSLLGFVDDVEFLYVSGDQLLHFRSASRVGHSDMGANRKRLEAFFQQAGLR